MKIGLLVNPYAGLGGKAGLKGSDGAQIRDQALQYHEQEPIKHAIKRTQRFFDRFSQLMLEYSPQDKQSILSDTVEFILPMGELGALYADDLILKDQKLAISLSFKVLPEFERQHNSLDSKLACQQLLQEGVDLLLFVGGDGTARDVLDALNANDKPAQLCLGIPSGVKMQSGVFAISPEAAAEMLLDLICCNLNVSQIQDVRDIDEQALRESKVRSSYYGQLQTLFSPRYLQHIKQAGAESDELALEDVLAYLEDELVSEGAFLIGPGSTNFNLLERMGIEATLVGFDALVDGELFKLDLNANECLEFYQQYPDLKILISPTPNQGFLLGRGNQQITNDLLKQLDLQTQLIIVATKNKLQSLDKRPLLVDTDEPEFDKTLSGFYKVLVAYEEWVLYPVGPSY